jgi:hypothetical protein
MTVPDQNDVLEDPLKLFLDPAHPAEVELSHDRGVFETPQQTDAIRIRGVSPTLRQAQNQRGSE